MESPSAPIQWFSVHTHTCTQIFTCKHAQMYMHTMFLLHWNHMSIHV